MQLIALGAILLALVACSGSSSTSNFNPFNIQCNPGTQVQLANPQPGQTGVAGNIGQIIIVANGNANTLYNTYSQWNLILNDNFGNVVTGGQLSLVPFPSGPHPYPSDFYYASSIPTLPFSRSWNVQLVQTTSNCSGYGLFGFST